ncbi:hypothetical protein [Haladaptatus caseinilyticus]|uniref:hypothetical protein n=1 Tax=Haladaptatus caseinilyticus TaxID=2993314 RepID=UPI00224A799B|nr:hypothetical protein [Haladaptatus caseinilyticus]
MALETPNSKRMISPALDGERSNTVTSPLSAAMRRRIHIVSSTPLRFLPPPAAV